MEKLNRVNVEMCKKCISAYTQNSAACLAAEPKHFSESSPPPPRVWNENVACTFAKIREKISLQFFWNTHKFMWKPCFCQRIKKIVKFLKEKLFEEIFINLAKVSKQWQFPVFFTTKRNCENLQHCAFSRKREKSFFVFTLSPFFSCSPVRI